MQIYFVKNQLFDSAKVLRNNNSVTDSYRILPISTAFYRFPPKLGVKGEVKMGVKKES